QCNSQVANIKSLSSSWTKGMDDKGIEGYFLSTQEGVTWNYFYDNGNIEREISLDLEGKQHGKSTTYWDNGQIHITKSYNHGIENDFRYTYFENGQFEEKDYESKTAQFNINYYKNGQLKGVYINCIFPQGDSPDKRNCKVGYYFARCGEKDIDFHHSQSYVEGINIKKWTNGKICFEGNILNGVQHAKWTFYYEDGTKSSETYFKNGIQDSIFESWFPNGKLNSRIVFDENSYFKLEDIIGRKHGYKETYYSNGQLKYKEEGLTKTYYSIKGELIKKEEYEVYESLEEGQTVKSLRIKEGEQRSQKEYAKLESSQTHYNSKENEIKISRSNENENNSESNQQNSKENTKNQVIEEPAFPGGYAALMKYIHQHLNYPKSDELNMIQGKVILVFYIETDGRISDINLVKGVSETMNAEALRIVKSMPNWIPGTINGIK
ncbi:MAG: hypothetical protein EBQ94_00270, partial [Flavobacteriales bacterium]|nr:hypothetical protein [Flavobacteriales bacterium]